MSLKKRAIRAGVALGLLILLPLGGVYAQEKKPQTEIKGITVSPSHKEVILGPGLIEAKTTITIENKSGKDIVGVIRLVDFGALDEFGGVTLSEVGAPLSSYSLAPWMSLPNGADFSVAKDQKITVPITIQNRDDLAPGGHYGAAIVTVSGAEDSGSSQISLRQEVASLLFVKKVGGETYGLELESIKADDLPQIPESIGLKFKSTGNVHVIPRGYIEITDPKGNLIAKGIINPESTLVLPDKSRQFVSIMQPVAEAKARGEYKITAYYRYDGSEQFQSRSITFKHGTSIVSTGIILLVVISVTGVSVVIFRNKRRKKAKNR